VADRAADLLLDPVFSSSIFNTKGSSSSSALVFVFGWGASEGLSPA
jgi:hypothetical protein